MPEKTNLWEERLKSLTIAQLEKSCNMGRSDRKQDNRDFYIGDNYEIVLGMSYH